MVDYTADALIASLKRSGMLPTSEATFSNTGFLDFLNRRMLDSIVPEVMRTKSEFFVVPHTFTLVANKTSYELPDRAISDKLRAIYLNDSSGTPEDLEQITLDAIPQYVSEYNGSFGIYIIDNLLKPYPVPTTVSGEQMVAHYYRRPNYITLEEDAAKITEIDGLNVTVSSVPSTHVAGAYMDFIGGLPPFKSMGDDIAIESVNGLVLTFASVPEYASVGDYVCLRGHSPIPQIPFEFHSILGKMAAKDALIALRDFGKARELGKEIEYLVENMGSTMSNRIEDKPKKIIVGSSLLR